MNFLQLVQRFRSETNYSNAGPTTTVGQSGDHGRAVDWVADAWREIQNRHLWRWMRKEFTLTTSSGTGTYDYTSCIDTPTSLAISRLKSWRVSDPYNRPTCYLQSAGVGTEYFLSYMDWDTFSQIYKVGTQSNSAPSFITVDPSNNLVLGPTPDDTYVVTGEYHRSAQTLSADTDEPELPSDYHMLIVYTAMEDGGMYESADEILSRSQRKGRRLMRQLEVNQLSPIRKAGPLA